MPFSSGTYSLPSGNPVVTGTTISSTTTNTTNSDIATALSSCILKDGTQTVTANIPMASHKFTGLIAGSATGDSARYDELILKANLISPALVTPNLGTPSAGVLTNCTGTAAGLSIGGNAATVTTNANLTGAVTSVGNAASLGSFTSAQLATALTDETGSGNAVFGTSPTLTTPTINSAQVPTISGTAPLYMCRSWVNFNGTGTVAIRASGNVSSITDGGVGIYTVNFTTAMPDVDYSALVNGESNPAAGNDSTTAQTYATSSVGLKCRGSGGGAHDPIYVTLGVFR